MISPKVRYQVFISSTFIDLIEERAKVKEAILEMGHMPYGMEDFPAANESQWEWIEKVIEESDYYIVIIGGKYGSMHPDKEISYTEMEYRYALEKGVPSIAFIIDQSVQLTQDKIEFDDPVKSKRLKSFISYLRRTKLCKFYKNADDLRSKVFPSLKSLMDNYPRTGWIKANALKDFTPNSIALKLENENILLKNNFSLAQGEEVFKVPFTIYHCFKRQVDVYKQEASYLSWNDFFIKVGQTIGLNGHADAWHIKSEFEFYIEDINIDMIPSEDKGKYYLRIDESTFDTLLFQLEALDYIRPEDGNYSLTDNGRIHLINLKGIKSQNKELKS